MNDKLDHFVLEYDDASGNALLAMTEGDPQLICAKAQAAAAKSATAEGDAGGKKL